jgi:hypothetical protein
MRLFAQRTDHILSQAPHVFKLFDSHPKIAPRSISTSTCCALQSSPDRNRNLLVSVVTMTYLAQTLSITFCARWCSLAAVGHCRSNGSSWPIELMVMGRGCAGEQGARPTEVCWDLSVSSRDRSNCLGDSAGTTGD